MFKLLVLVKGENLCFSAPLKSQFPFPLLFTYRINLVILLVSNFTSCSLTYFLKLINSKDKNDF